jgi:organic hydroperoxide reductase OsmC/OhrA
MKLHLYHTSVTWTGNTGEGTKTYRSYERSHTIGVEGRPEILGSSDPSFRGDATRYSPEDLLVASVSSCHMLWFLHLSCVAGIVVTGYVDRAEGTMVETDDGGGHFEEVILRPLITIDGNIDAAKLEEVHHKAHQLCFIANSCNFPIRHQPEYAFE